MDVVQAKQIIEALLFVSGQPVSLKRLKEIIEELDPRALRQLISQLSEEYAQAQRAIRIQEVADGFQLVTDPALSPWMKRALALPKEELVSKAAMETLAIIAYRQPITKAEVELIRGVDVTATLETLLERQFVRVAGRKDTPGRPLLYGTTAEFLRHFGLKSLEDLPPMGKGAGMPTLSEPEAPTAVGRLIVQPGSSESATAVVKPIVEPAEGPAPDHGHPSAATPTH
jgi:segregation and condensation protein B